MKRRVFRAEGVGLLDSLPLGLDIIDVDSGRAETLIEATGSFRCSEPRWSPRGDRILYLASFDADAPLSYFSQLRTVDATSGTMHDVLGEWGGCRAAEWLPDGERITFVGAAAGTRAIPNTDVWVVEVGAEPECRFPDNPGLVGCRTVHDMPIWDLVFSRGLVVASNEYGYVTVQTGGDAGIWKVALQGTQQQRRVVRGERTCVVLDTHPSRGQLFVASDMHRPTELYLTTAGEERQLTHLNDKIVASWPEMRAEHVHFTAHDGLDLEGWFLTRTDSAGPQPTVLNIHGGPYLSVGHAFRFDLHLLASHGFSVMCSNFRGSTGYGQQFMDAIGDDWGNTAFPDHMAAIDAAIRCRLADPSHLGVWGNSHGGFATCWVVGHTGRFAAAVAEAAVTDFTSGYYTCDIPDVYQAQFGGRPHEVPNIYRERSPLTYASKCTTPILMLHCEDDLRCPLTQRMRSRCRLFIAPSAHNMPGYHEGAATHAELHHAHGVATGVERLYHWHEAVRNGTVDSWPTVIYYLMGANEWRVADAWPVPEAEIVPLYLGAGGILGTRVPQQFSEPDTYTYDPDDPTPTVGGSIVSYVYPPGSVDVSDVQLREDVVSYTTEPLEHDIDLVGPLRLILHASSSAVDTDFVARLTDVFPDGRAIQLQNGVLRTRYRVNGGDPVLLEPGRIYRFEIDMWATANRFKAGHRIRVDISSADFPRYDRNANRGGEPGPPIRAQQSVYHDPQHPSHLLVSVLDASAPTRQ